METIGIIGIILGLYRDNGKKMKTIIMAYIGATMRMLLK